MSKAEQVALGTTLAGVNQYKVFSAVMTNFKTAVKASEEALTSQGSAERENAKYMESIQAKTQALRAELQKLIFQENVLQNAFKSILTVLIQVAKFFNSFYGKIVLIATALALAGNTIMTKLIPALSKSLPMALYQAWTAFSMYTSGVWTATEATTAFNAALGALSLNSYTIAFTAIVLIITAASIALYKLSKSTQDHIEKLKKQQQIIEETKDNIKNYTDKLKEINDQIDEINKKGLDIDKNSEDNLTKLRLEREELEEIIRLEAIKNREAREESKKQAESVFKGIARQSDFEGNKTASAYKRIRVTNINKYQDKDLVSGGYLTQEKFDELIGKDDNLTLTNRLEVATARIKQFGDEFTELSKKKEQAGGLWSEKDEKALNKAKKNLDTATYAANDLATTLKDTMDSTDSSAKGFQDAEMAYKEYQDILINSSEETKKRIGLEEDLTEETEEETESIEDLADAWKYSDDEKLKAQETLDTLKIKEKELSQQIGMSSLELVRQAEEWRTTGEALYYYLIALNQLDESLDNIQSNYQVLKSAVDEYNELGGFSVDTLQALLKLSPEYLQAIFDENGELRLQNGILELNEQAIKDKVSMMALEAKQDIYNNAIKRILNLTEDENTEKNIINKKSYEDSTKAINRHSDALLENTKIELANTVANARKGNVRDTYINQVLEEMEEQLSLVDKMVEGLGKDFSSAMSSSSQRTKEANEALKEQNNLLKQQKQELEDKKKQYDSVVSYIKKKIQGEIDKLKDQKKAEVDAIKDKIDAIKDEKEAESDKIDEQIDKLKEQKEIEEEYWQKKIDALKEQNEELNTQLEYEKLLEDLAKAKAKRVRVYEEGKGFVYKEDTNEIDKVQSKLDEFNRKQSYEKQLKELEEFKKKSKENYEKQIEDLEKLKKQKEKNYDEQIKKLEEQQKAIEDSYDAQIKYFQDYLDKFTEETDAYENQQNRLLALQLTGIDFEAQGWQTRLDNLADFVEKYNALLGDIHTLESAIDETNSDPDDDYKRKKKEEVKETISEETKKKLDEIKNKKIENRDISKKIADEKAKEASKKVAEVAKKTAEAIDKISKNNKETNKTTTEQKYISPKHKATGDSYIKEDGVYLVGDNPNQELVLGSKINGSLMNLTKGSGVVNATSTNTLAGILNQLGAMGSVVNTSNTSNKNTTISIGNISLPNVSNGNDFVDYLQNFSLQMTQEAFA